MKISNAFIALGFLAITAASFNASAQKYHDFKTTCESLKGDFKGDTVLGNSQSTRRNAYYVESETSPVGAARCSFHAHSLNVDGSYISSRDPSKTFSPTILNPLAQSCQGHILLSATAHSDNDTVALIVICN